VGITINLDNPACRRLAGLNELHSSLYCATGAALKCVILKAWHRCGVIRNGRYQAHSCAAVHATHGFAPI
jgi:hypothetical protein